MAREHRILRIREILHRTAPFLLFATLIWMAHYWNFRSFGLYEDDYYRIPEMMRRTAGEHWPQIAGTFLNFSDQGRPLHSILIFGLSLLGFRIFGLPGIYLIGYAIVVANSFLFYLLLKRLSRRPELALLGGLAFCLFPADTTQVLLTHSLGLQPSLTILLIAFHLYLSGKTRSSYVVIFCSLLIYETVFPVFLVAPLLQGPWNSLQKRKLFRHGVVLGAMMVFVAALRRTIGEDRVVGLGPLQAALLLGNLLIGPITSLAMFVYRPMETLTRLDARETAIVSLAFLAIVAVLFRSRLEGGEEQSEGSPGARSLFAWISESFRGGGRLLVVGLLMLILAYPLTLTTLGFAMSGRGTRAHLAAVVGASTVIACLASSLLRRAVARGKGYVAQVTLAAWLALLVGFGLIVQRDYKASWDFQRSFWTDVVRLCPDVKDGTVIFVEPSGLPDNRQFLFLRKQLEGVPDTRQIKFLQYAHLPLREIYDFPPTWKHPPMVYRLPVDWKAQLRSDGSMPLIDEAVAEEARDSLRTVEPGNAILLETNNGRMQRRSGSVVIAGHTVALKEQCPSCSPFLTRGPLYKYLIRDADEQPDRYLLQGHPSH